MEVQFTLNGKKVSTEIAADTVLLNLLRDLGCKCEMWMRDNKLWFVYSMDRRKIPPIMFCSCSKH